MEPEELEARFGPVLLPATWGQEILSMVALRQLISDEFEPVLSAIGTDRWDLRRRLLGKADDLLLNGPHLIGTTDVLDPVETWRAMRRVTRQVAARLTVRLRAREPWVLALMAGEVLAVITAGVVLGLLLGWAGPVALAGLIGLAAFLALLGRSASYMLFSIPSVTADLVRREIVAPFLRQQISELVNTPEHEQHLYVRTAPGLGGLSDRDQIVQTGAADRLVEGIKSMYAGSIAVCGRRGVGKTTLLRSVCDVGLVRSNEPELRVMVSAPVDYDVREFVLHLLDELCTAVITEIGGDPERKQPAETNASERHRGKRIAAGVVAVVAAVSALGLLAGAVPSNIAGLRPLISFLSPLADPAFWQSIRVPAGGFLLMLAALAAIRAVRIGHRPVPPKGSEAELIADARSFRQRIGYLQTFTTGYSGGVKSPVGIEMTAMMGHQLAEQQMTLPEIVDSYREFAERTATIWRARYRSRQGRLVIGIDEIDRIHDADLAERFLNDLKAVFGPRHCVYLVSVSEEALARLQLRATGGRTAFDSAFDEIIGVDQLSFAEVRDLLQRRVAGISDPFVALCHALSGGLPRDVIRTARALIAQTPKTDNLRELAALLVANEVATIKHATIRSLVSAEPARPEVAELLRCLVDDTWPGPGAPALARAAADICNHGDEAYRLAVALEYLAAISNAFGPNLDATIRAIHADTTVVDNLARVRSALAIDPHLADHLLRQATAPNGGAAPA